MGAEVQTKTLFQRFGSLLSLVGVARPLRPNRPKFIVFPFFSYFCLEVVIRVHVSASGRVEAWVEDYISQP
jgi:hypothetical protein